MSKAFTKDDAEDDAIVVAPRAPLPEGVPNYVTASGLASLRAELVGLHDERAAAAALDGAADEPSRARARHALSARVEALDVRIASAVLVDPRAGPQDEARFGASVTLRDEEGRERRWRIVGVDQADATSGSVAFVSPLARAMLGKRVGDVAVVKTPHGDEELEIVALAYGDEGG